MGTAQALLPRQAQRHSNTRRHRLLARVLQPKCVAAFLDFHTPLTLYTPTAIAGDAARPKPPSRSPTDDYFSHRVSTSTAHSSASGVDSVRTPLASASGGFRVHQRNSGERERRGDGGDPSHSPRPSWTNLSGFFNTSVLNLRAGSPTTPGSPDRPLYHTRGSSAATTHSLGAATSHYSPGTSPHPSPGMPLKSPMRNFHQQPQYRSSDSLVSQSGSGGDKEREKPYLPPAATRQPSRGRASRGSPNVTFGTTSVALISGMGTVSTPGSMSPRMGGEGGPPVPRKRVTINFPETFGMQYVDDFVFLRSRSCSLADPSIALQQTAAVVAHRVGAI